MCGLEDISRPTAKSRGEHCIAQCYADPARAQELLGWRAARGLEAMCADAWRWQQYCAKSAG